MAFRVKVASRMVPVRPMPPTVAAKRPRLSPRVQATVSPLGSARVSDST
jgi:hypothetical protein